MEWLLAHGSSLDERNMYGCTPLLLAAINGHKAVTEWLLAHGASLDERNREGESVILCVANEVISHFKNINIYVLPNLKIRVTWRCLSGS